MKAVDIKNELVIAGVLIRLRSGQKRIYDAQLKAAMEGKDQDYDLAKMTEEAFALLGEEETEEVSDAARKLAELKDKTHAKT